LRIVQEVQSREVERVGGLLLLFLAPDGGGRFLQFVGLLLCLLVDTSLVAQFCHVNVVIIVAVLLCLLLTLLGSFFHDLYSLRICPDLPGPHLARSEFEVRRSEMILVNKRKA
ncbi:hypothetical protein KCU81_g613, partial [Aureobasidium melanogenum]